MLALRRDSIAGKDEEEVNHLATDGLRQALLKKNIVERNIVKEKNRYEAEVQPLDEKHKEKMKVLKAELVKADDEVRRCQSAAVVAAVRKASPKSVGTKRKGGGGGGGGGEDEDEEDDDEEEEADPKKQKKDAVVAFVKNLPSKVIKFLKNKNCVDDDFALATKADLTEEEVATLKEKGATEANVNDLERLGVISTPE